MARFILTSLFLLITTGVPLALTYLWTQQNAHQTARMGLDLASLGAWEMAQPLPVPALMGASFGVGVVTGMLLVGALAMRSAMRRRKAAREAAADTDTFTAVP